MKALVIEKPHSLSVQDVPEPVPAAGQVVVDVASLLSGTVPPADGAAAPDLVRGGRSTKVRFVPAGAAP